MSCYHPIEAWDYTGQIDLFEPRQILFDAPKTFEKRQEMIKQGRRVLLPCRKCVGCRLDKSREWANRIIMEQVYHQDAWFVTLTYSDDYLPKAYPVSPSGVILSVHSTLVKKAFQDFMKRLRFNSHQKLRYYAAGEYGTTTFRPHYHALIFGLHLDDLHPIQKSVLGDQYYTSDLLDKCWPFGYHILGKVTWQSAAYVARYTMKKATHGFTPAYFKQAAVEPEFQTMSLKPAIGRQYYDDHPELFDYNTFSVSTPYGGRKMTPPEYFKKLYKSQHPLDYMKRSLDSQKQQEINIHLKLLLTDKDYYDILSDEEEKKLSDVASLIRSTL